MTCRCTEIRRPKISNERNRGVGIREGCGTPYCKLSNARNLPKGNCSSGDRPALQRGQLQILGVKRATKSAALVLRQQSAGFRRRRESPASAEAAASIKVNKRFSFRRAYSAVSSCIHQRQSSFGVDVKVLIRRAQMHDCERLTDLAARLLARALRAQKESRSELASDLLYLAARAHERAFGTEKRESRAGWRLRP